MNDERLQELLQAVDRQAKTPATTHVSLARLRGRLRRRRIVAACVPTAIAAAIIMAVCFMGESPKPKSNPEQDRIAALQAEVAELRARTDAAVSLVQEVLRNEREQRQLAQVKTQFASMGDPMEEVHKQVDRTAFILYYRAGRLLSELGDAEGAIEAYEQVIKLFGESRWATLSQQRIEEIRQGKKLDTTDIEGDRTCEPKNSQSSC